MVNSENAHQSTAVPSWSPCKCWHLKRQLSQDSQHWPNLNKCEWSSSLWNSEWNSEWWTAAVNLSPSPNKPEIFSPSDPAQMLAVALYSEQRVWHNYRMSCQQPCKSPDTAHHPKGSMTSSHKPPRVPPWTWGIYFQRDSVTQWAILQIKQTGPYSFHWDVSLVWKNVPVHLSSAIWTNRLSVERIK